MKSFEDLTDDPKLAAELKATYGDIDRVELLVGLMAERDSNAVLGKLMMLIVGVDAFSQALTNPLLSENVFTEETFAKEGLAAIAKTSSFDDIVCRNVRASTLKVAFSIAVPPGSYGYPLIGRLWGLLDFFFISGWSEFLRKRQRKYGKTVFKTNLFQPTIVAMDQRAIVPLFASDDLVQERPGAGFKFQLPPLALVGQVPPSIYEAGPAHDRPKSFYIDLLQKRSSTLIETFGAVSREFFEQWSCKGTFSFRDEIEDFTVALIFQWVLGKRPVLADVRELYSGIFTHFPLAITRFFPGSTYRRALGIFPKLLGFVKSSPAFEEILSLARDRGLSDQDAVAKQVTFLLGMNAFLGTQSLLKSIIGELSSHPEVWQGLCKEMDTVLGSHLAQIDFKKLNNLKLLDNVLREVLRLHPPVFFIHGRATRDRVLDSSSGTFLVRQGELVMGVIPFAQRDEATFPNPDTFDPDRFDDRFASSHLIWPRGLHDAVVTATDRTCPGKDVALIIAKLFSVNLLRKASWQLAEKPQWDQRHFSLNVAAPKGPLMVEGFRYRN